MHLRGRVIYVVVVAIFTFSTIYYINSRTERETQHGNRSTTPEERQSVKWHMKHDKFERINDNIIYNKFNITKPKTRQFVNIIYIISSAPTRIDRRTAIRETWWGDCKSTDRVSMFI